MLANPQINTSKWCAAAPLLLPIRRTVQSTDSTDTIKHINSFHIRAKYPSFTISPFSNVDRASGGAIAMQVSLHFSRFSSALLFSPPFSMWSQSMNRDDDDDGGDACRCVCFCRLFTHQIFSCFKHIRKIKCASSRVLNIARVWCGLSANSLFFRKANKYYVRIACTCPSENGTKRDNSSVNFRIHYSLRDASTYLFAVGARSGKKTLSHTHELHLHLFTFSDDLIENFQQTLLFRENSLFCWKWMGWGWGCVTWISIKLSVHLLLVLHK